MKRMKKILFLSFFVFILAIETNAQVTIGSTDAPTKGAVLELKSDTLGFLPPRVNLVSLTAPKPLPAPVEGMVVYNLTVSAKDTLQAGLYYNTGKRWVRLSVTPSFSRNWFYMPSIVFDTSNPSDTELQVDLYQKFKEQLNDGSNTNMGVSDGAPAPVLSTIPGPEDLYYYVTAYDSSVFDIISISKTGVMTYKVTDNATDETFINIVFVEK